MSSITIQLPESFSTCSDVRSGEPTSTIVIDFVMDKVMHNASAEHENGTVELVMGEELVTLSVQMMGRVFSIVRNLRSLTWTDLQELSLHQVRALPL